MLPETLFSSLGDYKATQKRGAKLRAAVQEGISACASPTFNSSDTAAEQKAGPSGPWLLLSLLSPPPGILCGSALGVRGFDERHPHTLIVKKRCPFISSAQGWRSLYPLCLLAKGFLVPLPSSSASPSWKRQKKNPKALIAEGGCRKELAGKIRVNHWWG